MVASDTQVEEDPVAQLPFVDTHVHFSELRDPNLKYVWLLPDFTHPVLGDIGAIQAQRYWADDIVRPPPVEHHITPVPIAACTSPDFFTSSLRPPRITVSL